MAWMIRGRGVYDAWCDATLEPEEVRLLVGIFIGWLSANSNLIPEVCIAHEPSSCFRLGGEHVAWATETDVAVTFEHHTDPVPHVGLVAVTSPLDLGF